MQFLFKTIPLQLARWNEHSESHFVSLPDNQFSVPGTRPSVLRNRGATTSLD